MRKITIIVYEIKDTRRHAGACLSHVAVWIFCLAKWADSWATLCYTVSTFRSFQSVNRCSCSLASRMAYLSSYMSILFEFSDSKTLVHSYYTMTGPVHHCAATRMPLAQAWASTSADEAHLKRTRQVVSSISPLWFLTTAPTPASLCNIGPINVQF